MNILKQLKNILGRISISIIVLTNVTNVYKPRIYTYTAQLNKCKINTIITKKKSW